MILKHVEFRLQAVGMMAFRMLVLRPCEPQFLATRARAEPAPRNTRRPLRLAGEKLMTRLHVRHAATLLALLGVGLAMGAPFILGAHAVLARLRSVSLQIFAMLAASAVLSAAANAASCI
jgi:hypothetical protein